MVDRLKMKKDATKAIALLSGGIDSPVAIHLLKDKLEIAAVHFHQIPLTDEREREKVKELFVHLGLNKLYLISFAEILKELVEKCDHRYYYILSKIVMYKVAEKIAAIEGADFLITGENLAQVSSQTLSSMHAITSQINMTILRPLLCMDKQEIVDIACEIGSFEISKGPEMCSLLGPKNPITKARLHLVEKELAKIDIEKVIQESISEENMEIVEA
jgi:tRNA uracil 4-sulfurtransferase